MPKQQTSCSRFEVKGLPRLTAGCLETIMKAVVTSFGLPAVRISAHFPQVRWRHPSGGCRFP